MYNWKKKKPSYRRQKSTNHSYLTSRAHISTHKHTHTCIQRMEKKNKIQKKNIHQLTRIYACLHKIIRLKYKKIYVQVSYFIHKKQIHSLLPPNNYYYFCLHLFFSLKKKNKKKPEHFFLSMRRKRINVKGWKETKSF